MIKLIIPQTTNTTNPTTIAIIASIGPIKNKKNAIMCIVINNEYNIGLKTNIMMLNRK